MAVDRRSRPESSSPPPLRPEAPFGLGLRAQMVLALTLTLGLSAALTLLALRPLTHATGQQLRRRSGLVLVRAIAGQVSALPSDAELDPLLRDAVGAGALSGAAVLDDAGRIRAQAGAVPRRRWTLTDNLWQQGEQLTVEVLLPARGAFVGVVSLAPSPAERSLLPAVALYALVASVAALWAAYALLTRYIVRPVEGLTRAAERVAAGSRDARAGLRGSQEVVRAALAFNAMTVELATREAELSARVEQLERARREIEDAQSQLVRSEKLAVVGRLAAGLAHEIGNPLAAIVGLAQLLEDGGLEPEETRDFATRISREAERIHRTVRELLDYARAAPAPPEGALAEGAEVPEAVAQVLRLLAPQKTLRDASLSSELEAELPRVAMPSDRLVQVLLNLLLNAADAAKDTGDPTKLAVRARRSGEGVRLEVLDNGPGIPEELRARIFEPFFSTKPAGQGTGLGLAICASLVEQAGGTLEALDREDGERGARLSLWLPEHAGDAT